MLNALDAGGLTARTLREKLEMGQSTASQHLAASQAEKFVVSRRDGSSIWHRVSERLIWQLLDVARDLYERQPLAEPSKL